jgi:UDP-N-acetylmuramate dehydrogenase
MGLNLELYREENKPLAPFTTFRVGGPARWFVEATSEEQIAEATAWAREKALPLFVLGGGSNLLVSDAGFDGLVLRIGLRGVDATTTADGHALYRVAAGEDWDRFVQRTIDDGCAGLECLAGIPGTVGGTPVQNVGAYGQEVSSTVDKVRVFEPSTGRFLELSASECEFGYRVSRFNTRDRGCFIVTRVDYRLMPGGAPTVRYAELARLLAAKTEPTLGEVAAAVRSIRASKGMLLVEGDPDVRSAGSFFKNPIVTEEQAQHVADVSQKEPPRFSAGEGPEHLGRVKIPAAWLIEQAGFTKGYRLGAAGISSRHVLALVNCGTEDGKRSATAAEILALAQLIRDAVLDRFGISLEMEPVPVGF